MHINIAGRRLTVAQLIIAAAVLPLVLWAGWGFGIVKLVAWYWQGAGDVASLGQTGDLFGGINALFAAYAFAGVAAAAVFQYQTFLVVEKQQRQQAFEPLFFQLLGLASEASPERLALPGGDPIGVKHVLFGLADEMVTSDWFHQRDRMTTDQISERVEKHFQPIYEENEHVLGPYFRLLYQTFKLIDRSGLNETTQISYANIARATLDAHELQLLAINCATPRGKQFVPLIEQYGILKHLPDRSDQSTDVVTQEIAWYYYRPEAALGAEDREAHAKAPPPPQAGS